MGFRLRLVELARGAVNVVLQPGHWEHPRVDHIGIALDDDGFTEALERAADLGLKIQDHPGKRTFIATEAGLPARDPPAAGLDRGPPRQRRRAAARRAPPACAGSGGEGGRALGDPRRRPAGHRRARRRHARPLPAGRPRGPARARRRGPAVTSYGEAGVSLAKAEEVVERLRIGRRIHPDGRRGAGLGGLRRPLRARRRAAAGGDDRRRRDKAHPLAARGPARRRRASTSPRTARTTSSRPAPSRSSSSTTLPPTSLDLAEVTELVAGAAAVCREAGCAILGGETAELPGIYREGELDFAGTMVGIVQRDQVVDGSTLQRGRRGARAPLERTSRERFHARPRALSETGPSTPISCSRPRASTSRTFGRCAPRATFALSRTSPVAESPGTSRASSRPASGRGSIRRAGTGRPSTRGSTSRASPRTSSAVSSTSGSATAPSCARRTRRTQPSPSSAGSRRGSRASCGRTRRDRRPRLGTRLQPPGADRPGPPDRRRRLERRRRGSARAGGARGDPDRRLPARRVRLARGARPRDERLAGGQGRRARRLRRVHAPPHAGIPRALDGDQRPSLAPPRLSRDDSHRGRPRGRRPRDGRDRPLRRRGRRLRAGDLPGGRARRAGRHARDAARAHPRGRAPAPARGGRLYLAGALRS